MVMGNHQSSDTHAYCKTEEGTKTIFMKTMELNKLGLLPLTTLELTETDGGGWLKKLLKRVTPWAIGYEIIQNWDEVKAGFVAGWNFDQPKK